MPGYVVVQRLGATLVCLFLLVVFSNVALGVGGYIAAAGLWAAPVSGASMNPARSSGPALVGGDSTAYWVYLAGPLLGAVIAVGCALILRGRGGDPTARTAASGALPLQPDRRPPRQ